MLRPVVGILFRQVAAASLKELPWQPSTARLFSATSATWESNRPNPWPPSRKITSNLTLQPATRADNVVTSPKQRPLVLLLSWLLAKPRHLNTFTKFYTSRGCDVLTARIGPLQIMMTNGGAKNIAKDIVRFLETDGVRDQKVIVHSFSVGAYQYTEIIQRMMAIQTPQLELTSRIIGQIYDSPVDATEVAVGLSKGVTENRLLQKTLQYGIDIYLDTLYDRITHHYFKSSEIFCNNPVPSPSLFFYSRKDVAATAFASERAMWSLKNRMGYTNVYGRAFENSAHVCHAHLYREEYMEVLTSFLGKLEYYKEEEEEEVVELKDLEKLDEEEMKRKDFKVNYV